MNEMVSHKNEIWKRMNLQDNVGKQVKTVAGIRRKLL